MGENEQQDSLLDKLSFSAKQSFIREGCFWVDELKVYKNGSITCIIYQDDEGFDCKHKFPYWGGSELVAWSFGNSLFLETE